MTLVANDVQPALPVVNPSDSTCHMRVLQLEYVSRKLEWMQAIVLPASRSKDFLQHCRCQVGGTYQIIKLLSLRRAGLTSEIVGSMAACAHHG
jgi:hypothetical protein